MSELQNKMYDVLCSISEVISAVSDKNDPSEERFLNELMRQWDEGEQLLLTIGYLEVMGYLDGEGHAK